MSGETAHSKNRRPWALVNSAWLALAALLLVSDVLVTAAEQTGSEAKSSERAAAAHNTLTPDEIAEGWLLLFDGETLFGWQRQSDADWSVDDGTVHASEGKQGLLTTKMNFADYVLKLEFRASPKTNSGIFLRTAANPTDPASDCLELNIAAPEVSPFPTGSFVQRKKAREIAPGDSAWHAYEVSALGPDFKVMLDGKQVLEYTLPPPEKGGGAHPRDGLIGLQFREGPIEFRDIKLRPLGMKSIFNGRDLSGWRVLPGHASEFTVIPAAEAPANKTAAAKGDSAIAKGDAAVKEASAGKDSAAAGDSGVLHVKNGNGALESDDKHADFIMQLEAYCNGPGLNSGIFFRAIPGQFWQGYECQINNAMKDNERTLPKDFGTGAIYRRESARRIVADDFHWFTLTFIAQGPHMASWVNGYPVMYWTDTRKPQANARNGLRLEAGVLQIQGHDPTTDLYFRNLRIVDTPGD